MSLRQTKWDPEEPEKIDSLIRDSFSELVRKERRNLLAVSTVALFVGSGGLVPSEASAFGLRFSGLTATRVALFLLGISVYFMISFWLYASPDFRAAKRRRRKEGAEKFTVGSSTPMWDIVRQNLQSEARYRFWLGFEYVFPLLLGIVSIILLIFRLLHNWI